MKPWMAILCLFAFSLGDTARAAEWSLAATLGRANGDSGSDRINDMLNEAGLDARAESSDDNRTAWQISLGYAFTPAWRLELGYVDLGDVETAISGSTTDIDAFLSASTDIHPNTAEGFLISGAYCHTLGLSTRLTGVVRAGAFVWSSEYRIDGVTASRKVDENGSDFSYGLGLELNLGGWGSLPDGLATRLDWQRFRIDSEEIDLFALGLAYRFR